MTGTFATLVSFLTIMLGMAPEDASREALDRSQWDIEEVECLIWSAEGPRIDEAKVLGYFPHAQLKVYKKLDIVPKKWNPKGVLVLNRGPLEKVKNLSFVKWDNGTYTWAIEANRLREFLGEEGIHIEKEFSIYSEKLEERETPWLNIPPALEIDPQTKEKARKSEAFFLRREATNLVQNVAVNEVMQQVKVFKYNASLSSYKVEFGTHEEIRKKLARLLLGMSPADQKAVLERIHSEEERNSVRSLMTLIREQDRNKQNPLPNDDYFLGLGKNPEVGVAWWYGYEAYAQHYLTEAAYIELNDGGQEPRSIFDLAVAFPQRESSGLVVVTPTTKKQFKMVSVEKVPAQGDLAPGFEVEIEPLLRDYVREGLIYKGEEVSGNLKLWTNVITPENPAGAPISDSATFFRERWRMHVRHNRKNLFQIHDERYHTWDLNIRFNHRRSRLEGRIYPIVYLRPTEEAPAKR
jgi:hypothetical protein